MSISTIRRIFIVTFTLVIMLLGSVVVVNAQEDLPVPPAGSGAVSTPSSTYKYCVSLLRSNNNDKTGTVETAFNCYATVAEENAYRDGAAAGGWKVMGSVFRETNFGTGSGYMRYMGQRNCVAGAVSFSDVSIRSFFSAANLRSARANFTVCEDVKLWTNTNLTGNSIECVSPGYCTDFGGFQMRSLRFKD
jgi:hypothetical protein